MTKVNTEEAVVIALLNDFPGNGINGEPKASRIYTSDGTHSDHFSKTFDIMAEAYSSVSSGFVKFESIFLDGGIEKQRQIFIAAAAVVCIQPYQPSESGDGSGFTMVRLSGLSTAPSRESFLKVATIDAEDVARQINAVRKAAGITEEIRVTGTEMGCHGHNHHTLGATDLGNYGKTDGLSPHA